MLGVNIDTVGGVGSKTREEVNLLMSTTATMIDTDSVETRRSSNPRK